MSIARIVSGAAAAALLLTTAQTGQAAAPPNQALARLIALDNNLRSYTANVRADVAMHSFPYLSPTLTGIYYHKEPSKDKIVFTGGVPFIAQQFSNVYPHVESPSHWNEVYVISQSDDGTYTSLKLTPRSAGRIDHVDAKIADKTGELVQLRWNYVGGGYATLNQSYGKIGGYTLVTHQSGHFEDPNYNADVTSTYSNFKLNAQIPDSVFSG